MRDGALPIYAGSKDGRYIVYGGGVKARFSNKQDAKEFVATKLVFMPSVIIDIKYGATIGEWVSDEVWDKAALLRCEAFNDGYIIHKGSELTCGNYWVYGREITSEWNDESIYHEGTYFPAFEAADELFETLVDKEASLMTDGKDILQMVVRPDDKWSELKLKKRAFEDGHFENYDESE